MSDFNPTLYVAHGGAGQFLQRAIDTDEKDGVPARIRGFRKAPVLANVLVADPLTVTRYFSQINRLIRKARTDAVLEQIHGFGTRLARPIRIVHLTTLTPTSTGAANA